jgi:hypothetical protein
MTATVVFGGSPCFASGSVSGTEIANVWSGSMSAPGGTQVILSGTVSGNQLQASTTP